MEQHPDRPMEHWTDDEVLEQYRSVILNLSNAEGLDRHDLSAITEEILRRDLSLPEVAAASVNETVDWNGEGGGEDPSSGALPDPV